MPDVAQNIANRRAAGYTTELMVKVGKMVIDGQCGRVSAHGERGTSGIMSVSPAQVLSQNILRVKTRKS